MDFLLTKWRFDNVNHVDRLTKKDYIFCEKKTTFASELKSDTNVGKS